VPDAGNPSHVRSVIGSSLLLGRLGSEDLSAVLGCSSVQRKQPGRAVLNPREDAAVVIIDGVVTSRAVSSGATEYIRRLHAEGETVGLLGVLGHPRASEELIANDSVQILRVPGSELRVLVEQNAEIARACLRVTTAQLARAEHEENLLVGTTTGQRVSLRILELAVRFGRTGPGGIHITTHLTQQELAAWARVSLESAGRALQGLREAKILHTGRRELVVHDHEALHRRATQGSGDSTLDRLLASIG
jgi:CRP/FNR family transcriptional regulator, cyclic AMP receptor protein